MNSRAEKYKPHDHRPRNVNHLHQAEHERSGINQRLAVAVTKGLSTMTAVWLVIAFMAVWIVFNSFGIWHFDPAPFALLLIIINLPQIASTPLVMVGQSVISRKQELQADEEFARTVQIYRDAETLILQCSELLDEVTSAKDMLDKIHDAQLKQAEMLTAMLTPPTTTIRRKTRKQAYVAYPEQEMSND